MLGSFRTRARPFALTALLVFAVGNGAVVLHAHPADGASAAVQHDASAHRFGDAAQQVQSHPEYCLACGWRRSLRQLAEAARAVVPVVDTGTVLHIPVVPALPSAALAVQPPLRAPPHPPVSA
jgi:hypothetical protein